MKFSLHFNFANYEWPCFATLAKIMFKILVTYLHNLQKLELEMESSSDKEEEKRGKKII